MKQRHIAALSLALVVGSLAGCASGMQGDYQPTQRAYVPLPTGEALRAQQPQPYMMPIQRSTTCTTQRIGNQLQTYCQ